MQKLLIQHILSPLCRAMGRFSEKKKDALFLLGGTGIVILTFLRYMEAVDYRYLYHFTGCCFCLGLMILASLGEEVKPVSFRKSLSIPMVTLGILLLISGIVNNVNYLPEAALLLAAYPVVYICWSNSDHARIFRLLIRVCKMTVILFAAASWLLAPIGRDKYPGIFTNTNNAAYYLTVVCAALLLDILYGERSKKQLTGDILLLGLTGALNYYTNSRTGVLGVCLALIFGLTMYLLRHSRRENLACLGRLAAGALACVIFVFGLVYVYQLRQWLPLPYFDGEDDRGFYTATRQELLDEHYPDWEEEMGDRLFFDASGFFNVSEKKTSSSGKNLDTYSTGRISIWLAYAEDLNLTGHESVPPKFIEGYNKEFESTHMTCLQIAYESGIPAGLVFLLLNIATGILTLWYAWKHGKEIYAAGPLMFTVIYGVLSMLGSCNVSFGYLSTLFYYLVQFPIIPSLPEETP